jgi:plasmid stabilization system protein ParE
MKAEAKVFATPGFAANLQKIRSFFEQQDPTSATQRMNALRVEIRAASEHLAQFPASGRPPRCLAPRSLRGLAMARQAQQLAQRQDLTLREFVLVNHLVLYAQDESRVYLLAVKHTAQAEFSV